MSELLRNWVWSVACAGAVCALCTMLCPAGRVKNVLQMACACVMLLAGDGKKDQVTLKLDMDSYAGALAAYREDSLAVMSQSGAMTERLNRLVIEQQYREYILDKAKSRGESLEDVSVGVKWDDGGFWVPWEAVYSDPVSGAFRETVASELGIPEERQSVRESDA